MMHVVIASALFMTPQEAKAAGPVDPARVEEAIRRGVGWLKTAPSPSALEGLFPNSDELILLTLVHAGVAEADPVLQEILRRVLEAPLERTYKVALQAMALEEIDRVKHQKRIYACAQFLIDNQCKNGQWSYGEPTEIPELVGADEPSSRKPVASPSRDAAREFGPVEKAKPKVVRKILVRKRRDGADAGDNSNTQYAALGLRACHDAGIVLPRDVVMLAMKWLLECQHPDADKKKSGYGTGRGWDYTSPGHKSEPTLSMTAGAVGGLAIYDYVLDRDWKKNSAIKAGLDWLGHHFAVDIPERSEGDWWHYYMLYGLERAGILAGAEKFGAHDWYAAGARALLDAQQPDGSWTSASKEGPTWNTCFAILFLKKATRPLVASTDDRKK